MDEDIHKPYSLRFSPFIVNLWKKKIVKKPNKQLDTFSTTINNNTKQGRFLIPGSYDQYPIHPRDS